MKTFIRSGLFALAVVAPAFGYEEKKKEAPKAVAGHVFGWPFLKAEKMQPRGGTSMGGDVELFKGVKHEWKLLHEEGLSKKEKDRRAILAMQGAYRISFDFMETAGFTANFKPAQPYFSWGTERVIVLKDEPDFISLQHVMVMYFKDKEGKESGPHVMKHWRQDWSYEDSSLHVFKGNNTWKEKKVADMKGKWTQAVFQVDDSPRYETLGKWDHSAGQSTWHSEECWRPLPRREFSVRKDYNVLGGQDKITITPNGWVHIQNNRKLLVDGDQVKLLTHELGINRYEEITSPNLKAGDESFHKTEPYWQQVRKTWREVYDSQKTFSLKDKVDKQKLWMYHFGYAQKVMEHGWNAEEGSQHAKETIHKFLEK